MVVPKWKQNSLLIVWVLVWPLSLWLLYQFWIPGDKIYWVDILSFALLMCIVALFPLIVNNTPIFFVHGIGFAVFLYYGLFIEVVLTQLAVIILLIKLRVRRTEWHRIPVNMLMFLFVSLLSAGVYHKFGGIHGRIPFDSYQDVVPILVYVATVFISNQLLLKLFQKFLSGRKVKLFDKGFIWETSTTLLVLPVGFILYLLYTEIQVQAVYYVGIPFVSISFILMLYHSSQLINHYLQKTSEIGHELTGQLDVKEVIDLFIERITSLLHIDYVYVYEVVDDRNTMQLVRFYDQEKLLEFPSKTKLRKNEGVSGKVWAQQQGVYYTNGNQWNEKGFHQLPPVVNSLISLPMERNGAVVGVITVISRKKRAYEKYQYMILDILTNYLAVAIENAKNYEETRSKSERCPLTHLYNYRFFENYLQNYFTMMKKKRIREHISLILIDLDHFKSINDQYGHESGNEVLRQIAKRLTDVIGDKGIVARYGGEEFVVLLPETIQSHCLYIAEAIRGAIARDPFLLNKHILPGQNQLEIHITASLGIATYPDNCEDPVELIRYADRAMYVGAKQKGRNKVAIYEKLTNTDTMQEE
ncbi:sensor domain-containing diguanylate cyclase [Aquibacillus sp. 3ASR75-11]|uniref:Sensor domain-containing diguanylate cyclase n=1 Tax=Terrihalobacillus insolitus TaxID=2950438 RepID=A0A9X4AL56_9BACI|nr:sensor domain-containing diguanylate cyclase [Terrihalobacillus insolitus]MDC3423896.1 sensor domain-containing diguanylate cyclase [Terrihalobacillus insolitus]